MDTSGLDLLQGLGADRSNASAEEANIVYSGTSTHPVVDEVDRLTLKVRGNSNPSAQLTIYLTYGLGA